MHRSKNARLRPTALVSIAGLLLWAACSSKENDFFTTPPISGAGHGGTSGSAGSSSSGNTASGGAGTSATSGSGGSSTPNGGTSGSSGDTGGNSALGGTHSTGGAHTAGGTDASGGSDIAGAGEANGGGGVAEGGAPSAGSGGDTGVAGGSSGVGGTNGTGGASGFGGASAASGSGGVSGTSGAGGSSGTSAGSGGGGMSGTGAGSGGGGLSGMGGAGSSNAGAGGTSSPVTCSDDNGCQSSQFCAKSSCNAATGTCKTKPLDCAGTDATFAPVCGCDHMTYYSPCVADREGTNLASQGECTGTTVSCTRTDGGKSCVPAHPLARCYRPRTSCSGTSSATGVCWVMPDECPNEPQVNRYCGGTSGTQSCVGLCEGLFNEYPVWRDSSLCQ